MSRTLHKKDEEFYRFLRANKKLAASTAKVLMDCIPKNGIELPENEIKEFYFQLLDSDRLSSSTKHNTHYGIKYLCEFKGIPFDYKMPKVHRNRRQNVEMQDVKKLLNMVTKPLHRILILTHLYTGLRPSELLNLTIEDLDLERGLLSIRNTKTYRDRVIPLHEKLLVELREYLPQRDGKTNYLFQSAGQTSKVNIKTYGYMLEKYSKMANIKKVTPYQLRHTFATMYIENDGSILTLKHIMGHSDIHTTEIYCHENIRMIQKGYDKACPNFLEGDKNAKM